MWVEPSDEPYPVESGLILRQNASLIGVHGPVGRGTRHSTKPQPVGSAFRIEDVKAPFLTVEGSTQIRGIQFWYPFQTLDDPAKVIAYPPTIQVSKTLSAQGVTLSSLTFYGEYVAMDFRAARARPCEQILFEHCYGYPLSGEFIAVDYCYDIPRLLHCHVNPANLRYFRGGYSRAVIDSVVTGAPAAEAGLTGGDRIVAINGKSVKAWDEVLDLVAPVTSGSLTFEVERAGARLTRTITPRLTEIDDPVTGGKRQVGRVGIQVRDTVAHEDVGLVQSVQYGGQATWRMATSVVDVLTGLFSGEVSAKNLGGPIAIARTSVQAARNGAETLWSLIAFLSLNIAILNLVPIPVLDGGQILMVLAEAVKGSAFSGRTREAFARVGVLAVLALIVLVTFNDIRSVFTR